MNSSKLLVLDGKELATGNTKLKGKFAMLTLTNDVAEKVRDESYKCRH